MPLFQHRHHCALAKALEEVYDVGNTTPIIDALAIMLQRDNPRFNGARFRAACAGQPTPKDARSISESIPTPRRLWWIAVTNSDGTISVSHYSAHRDHLEALEQVRIRRLVGTIIYYTYGMELLP